MGTSNGTAYFARITAGFPRTIRRYPRAAMLVFTGRGVGYHMELPKAHVDVGRAGSHSTTGESVVLCNSTYSSPATSGWYITSLMTTTGTRGVELLDPSVLLVCAGNDSLPSLAMCRPKLTSRSLPPNWKP